MSAKLKLDLIVDDKGSVVVKKFSKGAQTSLDIAKKSAIGLGVGLAGSAAALAVLYKGAKELIGPASDLQETTSKFNVVFAGQEKIAEEWAKTLVGSYAMSRRESKQYLSSIQDLLVPMGMAAEKAGAMSFEVTKLAADLGSFNNMPTARVMGDIQSALVGNYETMKKYGVVLNATVTQEKALAMGLAETKSELTAGHKAQAAYALMVEGSTAAIGDMSRTQDDYANQLKKFNALVEDTTTIFGEKLLPVATLAIKNINEKIVELMETGKLDEWANEMAFASINALQFISSGVGLVLESYYSAKTQLSNFVADIYSALSESRKAYKKEMGEDVQAYKLITDGLLAGGSYKKTDLSPDAKTAEKWRKIARSSKESMGDINKAFAKLIVTMESYKKVVGKDVNKANESSIKDFKKIERQIKTISSDALPGYNTSLKETIKLTNELGNTGNAAETFALNMKIQASALENFRNIERGLMKESEDVEKMSWEAKLGYAQGYLGQVTGIFKQIADAGGKHSKKAFNMYKNFAMAEAAIQLASAIMGIWKVWSAYPPVAAGLTALVTGIAGAQMAIIDASEPHAAGGWITGGSGTKDDVLLGTTRQGNKTTAHWGMGGEFIVNKESARKNAGLLEFMNENYAGGGWVNKGYGGLFSPVVDFLGDVGGLLFGGMDISKWTLEDEFEKLGDELQNIIDGIELTTFEREMKNLEEWFGDTLDTVVELTEAGFDTVEMVKELAKAYVLQAEEIRKANIELARQQLMEAWSTQDTITELGSPKAGWNLREWIGHFELIAERIGKLDENSENYMQDLLGLTRDQIEVLDHIRDLQEKAVKELKSSISSIDDMILSLAGGDLAPVQSAEFFQTQYATLKEAATTPEGLKDFQDFIPDYLKFMESYGGDYNTLVEGVSGDLAEVKEGFVTQLETVEVLLGGIGANTDPIEDLLWLTGDQTTAINNMSDNIGKLILKLTELAGEAVDVAETAVTTAEDEPVATVENVTQAITDAIPPQAAETVAAITPAEEALNWINDQIEGIEEIAHVGRDQWETLQGLQGSASTIQQGGMDAWDTIQWVNAMQDPTLDRRQHGGLTRGMTLTGEAGPEWVVPTYEPERSSFLRDVGADPDAIGAAVARHLMAIDAGGKEIHINLVIDGKQIGNVVANQVGQNRELNQAIRQAGNR